MDTWWALVPGSVQDAYFLVDPQGLLNVYLKYTECDYWEERS